jgi:hypothetical protein
MSLLLEKCDEERESGDDDGEPNLPPAVGELLKCLAAFIKNGVPGFDRYKSIQRLFQFSSCVSQLFPEVLMVLCGLCGAFV